MRKLHLARLLREGDMANIRADLKRYPIGFGLDNRIAGDDSNVVGLLEEVGVTSGYVRLWGSGEVYREFMHVDDLAEACIFIMNNCDHDRIGEFINIGTGYDIKIKELAQIIKEIVGFNGEVRYDLSKPDGTPRKLLDVSRMNNLGWRARIGLEEGVRSTYEWYLKGLRETGLTD